MGKSQTTKLLALNELDKSPRSCGKHRRLNTLRKIVIGLGKKKKEMKDVHGIKIVELRWLLINI